MYIVIKYIQPKVWNKISKKEVENSYLAFDARCQKVVKLFLSLKIFNG